MMSVVPVLGLDLASLLCSRICHDLISPIGAVNNAIELHDEGEATEEALSLVRLSGIKASARLQFARVAFGAAGKLPIDSNEVKAIALCYMEYENTQLTWLPTESFSLTKNEAKLLLNLIFLSNACLPRGGEIIATFPTEEKNMLPFRLLCTSKTIRVPEPFMKLYRGELSESINVHTVQFYYTLLLSEDTRRPIDIRQCPGAIQFSAG